LHLCEPEVRFRPSSQICIEIDRRATGCGGTKYKRFWSLAMAQVCDICGKGPQFGNNISHAHNVTRRRWNVNLQAVKALVNGAPKRIRVCTSCIKSGKISKA
jgi:large subunit ribosomal protein L28